MNGIKLGFKLTDFAAQRGLKISSFSLRDGTTANILSNPKTNIFDFYHTKGDYLIRVNGYRGENSYMHALNLMQNLVKEAVNSHDACTAWARSINRYI